MLPFDVARCPGVGSDAEGWREGCEDCLRRTSPGPLQSWHVVPPPIIVFECEFRIAEGER
jgi:hypothetical protein